MSPAPVILITGCSSGFGNALAKQAISRGFRVIATARRLESIKHLEVLGCATLQLDITSPTEQLKDFAQRAAAVYEGAIDYLINNAGIVMTGQLEEFNEQERDTIFSTNLFGVMNFINAFLPLFRKQRSGVIVNISSESGVFPEFGLGFYAVTKAAIDMYSDCLREEIAQFGIKVLTIQPGEFETAINNNAREVSQRIPDYKLPSEAERLVGKRPGTAAAAAERMLDVITLEGVAKGRELPKRFALGEDSVMHVNNILKSRLAELSDWSTLGMGEGLAQSVEGEEYI